MQYNIRISGAAVGFLAVFLLTEFILYAFGVVASIDLLWLAHLDKQEKVLFSMLLPVIGLFTGGIVVAEDGVRFDDIVISSED